jgi:hypothetical protein
MIHRTYIVGLSTGVGTQQGDAYPNLDIAVRVPGSRAAPVLDPVLLPAVTPYTPPPNGWAGGAIINGYGWYYEIRSRALRFEALAGAAGFTPRTNLGFHLSICGLQDFGDLALNGNLLPTLSLSASLAPPIVANTNLSTAYAVAFPDPSYGPVIRVHNLLSLHVAETPNSVYLVNFMLAENKDEDFSTLGHA